MDRCKSGFWSGGTEYWWNVMMLWVSIVGIVTGSTDISWQTVELVTTTPFRCFSNLMDNNGVTMCYVQASNNIIVLVVGM